MKSALVHAHRVRRPACERVVALGFAQRAEFVRRGPREAEAVARAEASLRVAAHDPELEPAAARRARLENHLLAARGHVAPEQSAAEVDRAPDVHHPRRDRELHRRAHR